MSCKPRPELAETLIDRAPRKAEHPICLSGSMLNNFQLETYETHCSNEKLALVLYGSGYMSPAINQRSFWRTPCVGDA
jgi:hypothetical protein